MQSRLMSATEASTNLVLGFWVSWAAQKFIVSRILSVSISDAQSFWIVAMFTVFSFVRQYGIRRTFVMLERLLSKQEEN